MTGAAPARLVTKPPEVHYHDLQDVFDKLKALYFEGQLECQIRWGRGRRLRGRRLGKLVTGLCWIDERLITIHPALDQEWIPRRYVEWVVFHEMLHAKHGYFYGANGKRVIHSATLRAAEKRFRGHDWAVVWEQRNVVRLLRY